MAVLGIQVGNFFITIAMRKSFFLLLILFPLFSSGQRIDRANPKLSSDSLKVKYYFHEAIKNKFSQQYGVSYELLKRCLKLDKSNPTYFYELSIVSYNLGKGGEALEYASKAYYSDTANRYYALQYVQVLSLSGKNLEAVWIYEKLLKGKNATLEDYINLTYLFQRIGDGEKAIETLNNAEDKFGVNELIVGSKIDLYSRLKDYSQASYEAKKLFASDSLNARYLLILFELNLNFGYTDRAENYLNEAYKLDPNDALVLFNICNFHLGKGNFDLFFKSLSEYLVQEDSEEEAYKLLSKIFTNPPIAIKYLDKIQIATDLVQTKKPNSAFSNDLNSQIASLKGDGSSAISFLRKVVYSEDENEYLWERYLSLLIQKQEHDSIQIITDRLLNQYSDSPFIPFLKGISLWQMNKSKDALAILEKYEPRIANRSSIIPDYLSSMGDLYHALGMEKKAFKVYDQVLKIKPDHLSVLNNYAYYLSVRGKRLDDALAMSRITVDRDPANPTYLDTYGWILYMLNRYNEAEVFIRKAIVNGSDESAEVLEHYGDVLFMLNRVDEALTYWNMANKLEPQRKGLLEKIIRKKL